MKCKDSINEFHEEKQNLEFQNNRKVQYTQSCSYKRPTSEGKTDASSLSPTVPCTEGPLFLYPIKLAISGLCKFFCFVLFSACLTIFALPVPTDVMYYLLAVDWKV